MNEITSVRSDASTMNQNTLEDAEEELLFAENDFDLFDERNIPMKPAFNATTIPITKRTIRTAAKSASTPSQSSQAHKNRLAKQPGLKSKSVENPVCSDDFADGFWDCDISSHQETPVHDVHVVNQPKISDSDLENFLSSSPPCQPHPRPVPQRPSTLHSSPPPIRISSPPLKVKLTSEELDALADDPEWGFDGLSQLQSAQKPIPKPSEFPDPLSNQSEETKPPPRAMSFSDFDFNSSLGNSIFETKSQEKRQADVTKSPTDSLPTKSQAMRAKSHEPRNTPTNEDTASSYIWSTSPDLHKTETLFSRRNILVQNTLSTETCGIKRSLEPQSPEKISPKSAKISPSPLLPTQKSNIPTVPPKVELDVKPEAKALLRSKTWSSAENAPSPSIGPAKVPRKVLQTKLTKFISPVVKKAHASTLADDITARKLAGQKGAPIAPIFLTEEQRRILSMVVDEGRTVFFTGAAGTGKSVLLRRIISELRRKYKKRVNPPVAVTASTGLAACNIGGMTLHSFAGIGLGEEPVPRLVEKIRNNKKANRRWKDTKVLIIDEISMIDGGLFDKLEEISRIINKNTLPFGGIQLVITGDFFQLPPVFKASNVPVAFEKAGGGFETTNSFLDELETEGKFSFEANSWKEVVTTTVELKQVFRQKDNTFSNMLNSIRAGTVTDEIVEAFQSLKRPPQIPGDITPTELFPLRKDVDNANRIHMNRLRSVEVRFEAKDMVMSEFAQKKLDLLMCPQELRLKRGAQVMLIKNMDESLVNGSLGKVLGFMSESSFKLMKNLPDEKSERIIKGEITAQGAVEEFFEDLANNRRAKKQEHRFDDNDIDELMMLEESRLKENPQAPGVDIEAMEKLGPSIPNFQLKPDIEDDDDDAFGIKNIPQEVMNEDPEGINWERKKALIKLMNKTSNSSGQAWPYVRFLLQDGTTRDVLIQPETWKIEDYEGRTEGSRSQVPLILAWALSIHKSQGQTLEWVKVDLTRIFEKGQAYVALSRAVRMSGLQVIGFERSKIMVHHKVIDFYAGLVSALDIKDEPDEEPESSSDEEPVRERRRVPRRSYRELSG